jgi:hypothetical protein
MRVVACLKGCGDCQLECIYELKSGKGKALFHTKTKPQGGQEPPVLGIIIVEGPTTLLPLEDEEGCRQVLLPAFDALFRCVSVLEARAGLETSASGFERLSKRLLLLVDLLSGEMSNHGERGALMGGPVHFDPLEVEAACFYPFVKLIEEATCDYLRSHSAKLYFLGRDAARRAATVEDEEEDSWLELWSISRDLQGPGPLTWFTEKHQLTGAQVWRYLKQWLGLQERERDAAAGLEGPITASPTRAAPVRDGDFMVDIRWPQIESRVPVMSIPIVAAASAVSPIGNVMTSRCSFDGNSRWTGPP